MNVIDNRRMVLIDWVDASLEIGWRSSGNVDTALTRCQTIGFLIAETKDAVVVAFNLKSDSPSNIGDTMTIPKGCIVKRTTLPKPNRARTKPHPKAPAWLG